MVGLVTEDNEKSEGSMISQSINSPLLGKRDLVATIELGPGFFNRPGRIESPLKPIVRMWSPGVSSRAPTLLPASWGTIKPRASTHMGASARSLLLASATCCASHQLKKLVPWHWRHC